VIKSQTKAKKRSLEWEQYRSPKARIMSQHNRDKMLQNCWPLEVRKKGSSPSAKEHSGKKELLMHECKLPLNKCISPYFSSLDAKLPLETWIGYFRPPCW
jgi:hypothetical protein